MTLVDKTAQSQGESLSFEFDLHDGPEKVWRALTDPVLLAEWLLPVVDLQLEPGSAFTFKAQPQPGWDGQVNCRFVEIEAQKKLSYTWVVGGMDTVVTFTLTPRRRAPACLSCSRASSRTRSRTSVARATAGR